jgi:hypothetical protein
MMSDGIKFHGKEESMKALDLAEIVWKAMGLEEEPAPVEVCAARRRNRRRFQTIVYFARLIEPGLFLWITGR